MHNIAFITIHLTVFPWPHFFIKRHINSGMTGVSLATFHR